jgi:uncharacterized protein YgbK (DUF1537 family)
LQVQLKNLERNSLKQNNNILLAFYGDDFTGSTDALEFISKAGAKTILFTETPTAEQLNTYPGIEVFGVAGITRSLPPGEMEKVLLSAFEKINATGVKHVHYKICSTFDSSPTIGSIGKAIDCGAEVFKNTFIPVLGGMPALGRFCVFGNLFAKMGIGSEGKIYRLDRHPSMSKHPATPMDESDLRIHLGKQTNKSIGLIDIILLKKNIEEWNVSEEVVLVDSLSETHLEKIGQWLNYLQNDKPLFSVGSSAVEMALGKYWCESKRLTPVSEWKDPGKAEPLLVVSGSCSPVTAKQITYAKANGFEEVIIDAVKICEDGLIDEAVIDKVKALLQQNKNLVVHTGEKQLQNLSPEKLGTALGNIAKDAAKNGLVKRIVIAGGDTSSYAARAMEIEAVSMIAPIVSGAPLCRAYSKNKAIDGLEVNFKGGQVGDETYYGILATGNKYS